MKNRFENISDEMFIQAFNNSISKEEILRKLNISSNGTATRYVNKMVEKLGLSFETLKENHFNKYHIKKICPVCGKEFYTDVGEKGRKQECCSYACSNTYFRSGENNGQYKSGVFVSHDAHKIIGFRHHPHRCCVCGEEKIVAIHHYDGNHNNNEPTNLVPLCPTHHQYIHSRFKDEIIDKVDAYVEEFKKNFEQKV